MNIETILNETIIATIKELYGQEVFTEESIETPHELWVSLNVHKDHIYSLLSILGYYHRHNHYFLSQSDFYQICYEYSKQVHYINRNRFHN